MSEIFLSYSSIDDVGPPNPGWIRDFHRRLSEQLSVATGTRYEIWLDTQSYRLNQNVNVILTHASQASILVTIVSPGHAGSRWCADELVAFLGEDPNHPRALRDMASVFKVRKLPLTSHEQAALDPRLRASIGYQFHGNEANALTYHPDWHDLHYHTALNKLVGDLKVKLVSGRSVKVALFGIDDSPLLREVRRNTLPYAPYPETGSWPTGAAPYRDAVDTALTECELVVMAFERGVSADQWLLLEQATAAAKVRKCMVWLHQTPSDAQRARLDASDKCEVHEGSKVLPGQFAEAVLQTLQYLERNPLLVDVPWRNGQQPRSRVHVVYPEDEAALAEHVFAEAERNQVQVFDSRYKTLKELAEHAAAAEAILVATSSPSFANSLMKTVKPRLLTASRGGVGFDPTPQPLEADFRYLGKQVTGVFAHFPP
jgi:hypothetical protein